MKTKFKETTRSISRFFKAQRYRRTSLVLAACMILSMIPSSYSTVLAESITTETKGLNMYNLSYLSGIDTSTSGIPRYYTAPIVSGTDNSPTITFPQTASGYVEGTICSGGTVTSKYSMDFTRSFNIEGKVSFASRDGIGFALHNNPNKKVFLPNYSTCMIGQAYDNAYYSSSDFTLDSGMSDISKGLLWEFMQITDDVADTRGLKGAYSYKINSLTNMTAFPDDNTSGYGAYGIKNYGISNQDGAFELKWECTNALTATGKLIMTMGGSTFTYSNLCAQDVFGSIDNAKAVYFTMSSWAPPLLYVDDKTKTSSITIDKAYYTDSAGADGSTFGVSTKYYIDNDNNGSYETLITGSKAVDPDQKVLVRNIITNQNKNATTNISTSLLVPNLSVFNGTNETKINSVTDQKLYWKEHNGVETLKADMLKTVGSGPFNTTNVYNNYAKVTLPAGGDGTNIYNDAYAIYEYVITPTADSKTLKQTVQIGVAPFTPAIVNSEISFEKSVKAGVTLNKPIFNNDKSGYSFKSAAINNFTGVKSITFSITKGTTVQSVPTFLTPSSKLESINGDTRTFTYVFENGVTVSQAEEFIRGIVFNYAAGAEISITVDNNVTKLPNGAKITKLTHSDGTDHYYMFVPSDFIYWTNAYNLAKSYSYMGLKGYLATITSKEEDDILTNISTISAWSAGTRYLNADNSKLADPATVSVSANTANYYYWACGPEAGTIYYNGTAPTPTPGAGYTGYNGVYNNWGANPKQPDANTTNEVCMQVNWPLDTGSNGKMRWNDLPNAGLPSDGLVKGYFVEFSNYAGGRESSYASDKTAVGVYNLATDGGVEEVATVALNAPVYGSGNKSEFSFSNAEVKNISAVTSLTIKLDNYTNVLSKPTSPIPTKELSNIAGTTNTITYLFGDGITQADAQSFLRGLKFRYGGLKTSSTTNVSVTVDGNKTNLPTGASITEFNGHYYMYVPGQIQWQNAYNAAKNYTYMGFRGYLATITSEAEDKVLTQISALGAWSGGSALLKSDGTKINDDTSYTLSTSNAGTQYYWTCGPEAGTVYYTNRSFQSGTKIGYNNWQSNQPDNYNFGNYSGIEYCMQINYRGQNGYGAPAWNDLNNDPSYAVTHENGLYPSGYFVEFSDYDGGRVDGFAQSASGASTVPISVEKGDVFNTVKDGGTYYVDTKLTAFDRNITKITVNNSAFTNGNNLAGNKNTTYTIVATDLEGNTATMTVTMKTIASISDPIKSLTVSNVQMSNKNSILGVKAALMAINQTDASDAQKTEISNAIQNWKNLYFALFNATSTATNGTNGWYKNGIGDIMLTAPEGFQISTSNTGAWTSSITVDKADGANKTAAYYLKEISTGDISGIKTFNYKVDTTAPTGIITIRSNTFNSFINKITFGLFFKSNVGVSISASDTLSTSVAISYQKIKDGEAYSESGTWVDGSSFSVAANEKFSVYAKLTDNAGNMTIINSDGVVVYTDSTNNTTDISFTQMGTTDVTAKVNLNGNTVKEIKNGANLIASTNYSVATDGAITFKASYLDSLAVGSYTLTISYNPMGESYATGTSIGDAPLTTTISLAVKAKDMSETGGVSAATVSVTPDSFTYNGSTFAPAVTVKDGTKTLVNDTDYTLSWSADMTSAGEKTLIVTFKENYRGTVTKKVTINNAAIADTTNKIQSATYNKNAQSFSAAKGTTINNQVLAVKYSTDGKNYNLDSMPTFTSSGNYTVYYQLSAQNHNSVTGEIAFKINGATDNSITDFTLNGWTFGEKANAPTANSKYGTISYTYSDSKNGTYTDTVPTQAGTYYVKASVTATGDYNSCEAKTSFTISDKAIAAKDIAISRIDEYYLFTNSEIKPEPTVTVDGIVLKKGIDYTMDYENNIQIGKNAKVIVTLKGNYSGTAEKTFEIGYGNMSDTEVKNAITLPDFNSNGWYNKDITIAAKDGWKLCKTPTGTFGNTLTISEESSNTGTNYTFYIKKADGSVYERTLNYKLDKTAPTNAKITIKDKEFTSLLNKITFGIFFKETVNVSITADGNISGIKTAEYQKVAKDTDYNPNGTWKSGSSFDVTPDEKFIVYARVTDNAGNYVVINSDGVIVDSTNPELTLTSDADDWTKSDVNVKVEASDRLAGVKEVAYTTDEKVPQAGTVAISDGAGTIKLSNEGLYKLIVTAKDNSGNEVSQNIDIKIDRTMPKLTGASESSSYFIGRVIKLADDLGEIANANYKKDAADEVSFNNEALFDKPGKYDLTLKDKAGNGAKLSFEIKAMPKVEDVIYTADSKALIDSIRAEFDAHKDLPESYKTNTDNEIKALEARYAKLYKEVMDIKAETSIIKGKVDALPKGIDGLISLNKEIQDEYNKIAGDTSTLTKEQKLVLEKEAEYLKQQLDIIAQLESQIDAIKTRVSSIDTKIDGLSSKEGSIKAILTDVDKLTKEQKNILQPQIDILNGLVDKINVLKEEVETVKGMISKLPSAAKVTKENLEQLTNVEKLYNKLTNEQKSLVGDYYIKWLNDCLDALRKLMLHNEENDLTVTGIDGTSFDSEVYLVVTRIKNDSADAAAKFAVSAESVEKAAETNTEIKNKELVATYDVSLFKDNVKVQPDGKVQVKIKIPEELKGRTGLDIVHIADDGTVIPMHAVIEDGYLVFITTHFSEYAIVAVPVAKAAATTIPKTGSFLDLNSLVVLGVLLTLTGVVVIRRQKRKA